MSYIRELQDVIWELHGVASRHVGTVPVKETLGGDAVWGRAMWKSLTCMRIPRRTGYMRGRTIREILGDLSAM